MGVTEQTTIRVDLETKDRLAKFRNGGSYNDAVKKILDALEKRGETS